MKKRIWIPIAIVVLLLVAFELTMEHRYSVDAIVPVDMTDEEILAEMPDIAITEEDHALEAYVLALPQVQEMLVRAGGDSEEAETMTQAEVQPVLAGWTQSGWSATELCAFQGVVYVSFREDSGETMCIYTFFPDQTSPMHKTIGVYAGGDAASESNFSAAYENRGGTLSKLVPKHQWFAWIGYLTGQK